MTTKHRTRKASCFFELNDTDGDLGIHGKIAGDEWKRLKIEDPHARKNARRQGSPQSTRSARGKIQPQYRLWLDCSAIRMTLSELRGKRLSEIGGDDAIA